MRLRHIQGAEETIASSPFVIQEPEQHRGTWNQVFGGSIPLKSRWEWVRAVLLWTKHPPTRISTILELSAIPASFCGDFRNAAKWTLKIFILCASSKGHGRRSLPPARSDRIYLNFSDPWPKDRHAKRRLTSPVFMSVYDKILAPQGVVEFKTDNRGLFEYSLESIPASGWTILSHTFDLHNSPMAEGNVMTEYEIKFSAKGQPICKLVACRTPQP